jgi:hypothetical protein
MTEYARTEYNFNDRIVLNDVTTDTDKYILTDVNSIADTVAENTEESRATDVGIVDYGTHLGKGIVEIPVTMFASSQANMAELIQEFKTAFNPDLLEADATYGEAAGKGGFHPLYWAETVGSTSRSFMIYLKSTEIPRVASDSLAGLVRKSIIKLKAQDPRKYLQTQSSITASGTATNAGDTITPVEITITASGATSTSLAIANSTRSETITVSTALSNGQVLVIDTRNHSVKLNGTERRDYISSASNWLMLNPGANTIALSNTTNCTISFKWYSAWSI